MVETRPIFTRKLERTDESELARINGILRVRINSLLEMTRKPGMSPEERITITRRATMLNDRNRAVGHVLFMKPF